MQSGRVWSRGIFVGGIVCCGCVAGWSCVAVRCRLVVAVSGGVELIDNILTIDGVCAACGCGVRCEDPTGHVGVVRVVS